MDICNLGIQLVETGKSGVQGQLGPHSELLASLYTWDPVSRNKQTENIKMNSLYWERKISMMLILLIVSKLNTYTINTS